eukprot:jgi/Bigna1/67084/fgenesh1_pg.3_\
MRSKPLPHGHSDDPPPESASSLQDPIMWTGLTPHLTWYYPSSKKSGNGDPTFSLAHDGAEGSSSAPKDAPQKAIRYAGVPSMAFRKRDFSSGGKTTKVRQLVIDQWKSPLAPLASCYNGLFWIEWGLFLFTLARFILNIIAVANNFAHRPCAFGDHAYCVPPKEGDNWVWFEYVVATTEGAGLLLLVILMCISILAFLFDCGYTFGFGWSSSISVPHHNGIWGHNIFLSREPWYVIICFSKNEEKHGAGKRVCHIR